MPICDSAWSRRTRIRNCISLRRINVRWKVSQKVLDERMTITWSNILRARTFVLEHFGYEPVIYSFDQKPFHMDESGSKACGTLSWKGEEDVSIKENCAATKSRWTGNTLVISDVALARAIPFAELMFNGGTGVLKNLKTLEDEMHATNDFNWLSLTTSDSGSYRTEHVIEYLEKLLEPWHEGRRIRILMCDAYAAHLDPAVRRLAWTRGYIVIYQGGGTTGVGQVNDTDLHEKVSDRYQELEQEDHLLQTEVDSGCCPRRDREDCIRDFCSLWKDPELHAFAAQGFKRRGLTNAIDGTEDHHICGAAAAIWTRCDMANMRKIIVADTRSGVTQGEIPWTYEGFYDIIRDFPKRGQMDIIHDGQEPQGDPIEDEVEWDDRSDVSDAGAPGDMHGDPQQDPQQDPLQEAPVEYTCSERAANIVAQHVRTAAVIDTMINNAADLADQSVLRHLHRAKHTAERRARQCKDEDRTGEFKLTGFYKYTKTPTHIATNTSINMCILRKRYSYTNYKNEFCRQINRKYNAIVDGLTYNASWVFVCASSSTPIHN